MDTLKELNSYARPDEQVRWTAAAKSSETCRKAEQIRLATFVASAIVTAVQCVGGILPNRIESGLDVTELVWFLCLACSALAQLNLSHCRWRAQYNLQQYEELVRCRRD
jgi:hypothetical protein